MNTETIETNIFEEIRNNFVSDIGEKYSVEALEEVWKNTAILIKTYLEHNKSTILKNVGQFSLGKWSLETGIRKELFHFQPVFKLSRSLLEHFDLHESKQYIDDKVPVAPIIYSALASQSNVDKETVMYSLQNVTQTLWKVLYRNEDVKMEFPQLGTLTIKNEIVRFTFSEKIIPKKQSSPRICTRLKEATGGYNRKEMVPCKLHLQINRSDSPSE